MKAEEKADEIKKISGLERAIEVADGYIQRYSNACSRLPINFSSYQYHEDQLKYWQEVKQHLTK